MALRWYAAPTGSGKNTTLNSTVREMDRFGRAIRTVEEPVEYRIPFVSQVNVNRIVGLDFATALRAFMRADPDVIILGEVRDQETASLTLRAAETGHMVMATLHTVLDPRRLRSPQGARRVAAGFISAFARSFSTTPDPDTLHCMPRQRLPYFVSGTGYTGRTVVSEVHLFPLRIRSSPCL